MILPRPHISWSAINCWLSSKDRFRREYFENSDKLDSRFLRFGKGMAKMIEEGKHKELLPDLITYDTPEYEIRCNILGVPILAYLDSYDSKNNVFFEFKTGIRPWDQTKVQKHDQLLLYATALKWKHGKMPEYCDLVWIQTKETNVEPEDFWRTSEINVTGKIISFHRVFDEREIFRMEELIVKVANEISEAYQDFITEI
jgi:hypothetical protein